MADYVARSAQASVSNAATSIPGTNLRQELVTEENVARWVAEGRVYGVNVGSVNTPVSFIGAVLANAVPELALNVPGGKYIIPLEVTVSLITCAAGVFNVALISSTSSVGVGGGSTAGVTINANGTFTTQNSGTVARVTFTSAGTALTNPLEVWRYGVATAQNPVLLGSSRIPTWSYKTNIVPRVAASGSFLVVTGEAGAATGYIQCLFAEFNVGDN